MIASMARLRRKQENGESGFTLIELLVVVVIIGILVAIAVPLYLNYRKGANDRAAQSDVRAGVSAIEQCSSDNNGSYPTTVTFDATTKIGTSASCSNMKINSSDGTTLTYAGTASGYRLFGTNSKGAPRYYCYDSTNGGQIKDSKNAPATNTSVCDGTNS